MATGELLKTVYWLDLERDFQILFRYYFLLIPLRLPSTRFV